MPKSFIKGAIFIAALAVMSVGGAFFIQTVLAWTAPPSNPPDNNHTYGWTDGGTSIYLSTLTDYVGIGLNNPNRQLHVKTASGNAEIDIQSASSAYWGIYQDDATNQLRFWNVDNRLTITADGKVGINTVSPQTSLDVNGPVRVGNYTTAARPSCTSAIYGAFIFDTTENKPYVCAATNTWKPLDSDYDKDGITDWNDQDDTDDTKKTATLLPGNIKSGVTIFGVVGTLNPAVTACYADTDGDTYGAGSVVYTDQPSCPGGYVSNNTDCAASDVNKWVNRTGYTDGDSDGYGAGTAQQVCSGSSLPSGYVANNNDCYNSNANAKPGQTNTYNVHRGDGSFDYDCSGVAEKFLDNGQAQASVPTSSWDGYGNTCYASLASMPAGNGGVLGSWDSCGGSMSGNSCTGFQEASCGWGLQSTSEWNCPTDPYYVSWRINNTTHFVYCR